MIDIKYHLWPIRTKVIAIALITSIAVLCLASIAFVLSELVAKRVSMVESATALARVLGVDATATLVFRDPTTAEEVLYALSEEKTVVYAGIFDAQGSTFASYLVARPETKGWILSVTAHLPYRFTCMVMVIVFDRFWST
ncbi:MAG: hypothetical protein KZQ89_00835 [Candidatus Thiodiazotropha sp. (ex Lucinoma kastoroae)]|nr:hypothetical protein [Candidatus Thiodiazotropha sp. (ex Lucinoma kastoroae)]MCU7860965.1 hypothetical protein [Candidatus Thiodiazotropha sp. (ex Lucinoma kastoroae)]